MPIHQRNSTAVSECRNQSLEIDKTYMKQIHHKPQHMQHTENINNSSGNNGEPFDTERTRKMENLGTEFFRAPQQSVVGVGVSSLELRLESRSCLIRRHQTDVIDQKVGDDVLAFHEPSINWKMHGLYKKSCFLRSWLFTNMMIYLFKLLFNLITFKN